MMTDNTPNGANMNVRAPFPSAHPEAARILLFLPHMQAAIITAALEQQQAPQI